MELRVCDETPLYLSCPRQSELRHVPPVGDNKYHILQHLAEYGRVTNDRCPTDCDVLQNSGFDCSGSPIDCFISNVHSTLTVSERAICPGRTKSFRLRFSCQPCKYDFVFNMLYLRPQLQ